MMCTTGAAVLSTAGIEYIACNEAYIPELRIRSK